MLKLVLSAAVALGAIGLLFLWGGIRPGEVWDAVRAIPATTFFLALGIQALIYVFRAARLRGLLAASGDESVPGLKDLTAASAAWILDSQILPAKVGEASLVLHLGRVGVRAEHGLVGLLLSRLFDLLTLVVVLGATCLALGLSGARPGLDWLTGLGGVLMLAASALALVILRGGSMLGLARRLSVRLGLERTAIGARISSFTHRVEAALRSVSKPALLRAALWSLPVWAAVLGVYIVLGTGVGLAGPGGESLGAFDLLFGSSLAIFGSLVPISGFLGFGALDLGWAWGFAALGVPEADAAATGLAFHTLYLVGVGILGAVGHTLLLRKTK
ncbi:hypothetical protein Poly30_47450 [Planctomycetes bacterium Poly30]|uniref:Flippase-like domain-containing protein n=1 Tax=Saltatorellus ferox TaxID=2528018 RepID=A0A518EYL9_9BACT|nr:hypothetical protein Poly30_47450 [Planctomycetes bacterium Poly30]